VKDSSKIKVQIILTIDCKLDSTKTQKSNSERKYTTVSTSLASEELVADGLVLFEVWEREVSE
jgi:hypothetical protein